MPKVEPSFSRLFVGLGRMVPIDALDRANAEIERITRQRDRLARWVRKQASWTNSAHDVLTDVGLNARPDGTVTEIGHG